MAGMLGHGDSFVLRDPAGIRPAYYYKDDEVVVVASERPVIQTVFNVDFEDVKELEPGHAIITKKSGKTSIKKILEPLERKACSFERIYFSRGSDAEIYQERKELGKLLMPQVLKAIDNDTENSVFSYIPNTAETSFFGMIETVEEHLNKRKTQAILNGGGKLSKEKVIEILKERPRIEKIAIKDVKLRTFITEDSSRDDLVAHVYEIRYPDCYGIDMANLESLVAFNAALALLKDNNKYHLVEEVYNKCKAQVNLEDKDVKNFVKEIYDSFTDIEISAKIAELLTDHSVNAEVEIIFQPVENLHKACPHNLGDWYFTGNYPTVGGNRVVNRAFINFFEGNKERAY